jgi:hypothetical protein
LSCVAESEYRAAGYEPPFEMLPTLDEYEVAEEAKGSRAPNEWEGSAMKYADLWMAMKRYKAESDAWQEFVGGVYEQTDGRWPNEVAAAEAPEAFARHWAAVAAGASGDFDVNGARASIPRRNQDGASIH